MLKYEVGTSLTLNIEKYCYFYLIGLADLWCLRGGSLPIARCASKEIPLYLLTGKSFQDQRTRVFVSRFSNDNKEFQ